VLTGFGILWFYNAMELGGAPRIWFVVMWAMAAALLVASIACIRSGYRAAGAVPKQPREVARQFWIIFGLEGAGIIAVVILFQLWHWDRYIVAAIAIIVGIHFLPLAKLFRAPVYRLTGLALVVCPLLLLAIMPGTTFRDVAIAYGAGTILWATALIVVAIPRR
jgi:F0F1-type ATP synthase membrane subunit c/vacuolar-type H+-ATPase subunit K